MLHHRLRAMPKTFELEYVQNLAAGSTSPATLSATPQAGDLLIYLASDVSSGASVADPTNVVPSGFTLVCTHAAGVTYDSYGGRSTIAYKIADGTESSLSGMDYWAIEQFRATRAIGSVSVIDSDGRWATGNPAAVTLDSPGALPALAVGVGRAHATSGGLSLTFSVSGETTVNPTNLTNIKHRYILYSASGNTLSADVADAGYIQGYSAAVLTVSP